MWLNHFMAPENKGLQRILMSVLEVALEIWEQSESHLLPLDGWGPGKRNTSMRDYSSINWVLGRAQIQL